MASVKMTIAMATTSTVAAAMQCPGSAAWGPHASAQVTAVAKAPCSQVAAEIKARADGSSAWVDPHNGGIYTMMSASDSVLETQRTTNPKTSMGGKVYADRQTFTLTPDGETCQIEACSESQGSSVKDFSTNYCDLRNLYCGSADGCTVVGNDFEVEEKEVKPSFGAGSDKSACIVQKKLAVEVSAFLQAADAIQCPGSDAFIHASARVVASTSASCDEVMAEVKARASEAKGWVDPHNGGIYSVLSTSDMTINTQRTANPKRSVAGKEYIDKQTFTFSAGQDGGCNIQACSESQGFSVNDFSTNYCDIRNLYCGSDDGCKPVENDFAVQESSVTHSLGAGSDKSACIVQKADTVNV